MDYVIAIFGLGLIVTFIVSVGLLRAAEFARSEATNLSREGGTTGSDPRERLV